MKKNIVILAEYIGENHNSTAYYWSQITKYLKNDYEIVLIVPENEYSRIFATKNNITTHFVKSPKFNKNKLLPRLLGQFIQTISFILALKKEVKSMDLLFSGTNPIITMFILAFIKPLYQFRWLVLVHDIFPNNLLSAGVFSSTNLIYKMLISISKIMYQSPDKMICIGRDMEDVLKHKIGFQNVIHYIPNWASTDKIPAIKKCDNEIISELGWENNVVYQFYGNMGRLQDMNNLLQAINLSQSSHARFLFIGCGSEVKYVQNMVTEINEKCGYQRVHFYGKLDLDKNHIGLNACDVSLVTLSENMYGLGVPSKAYFSMAADKPILYVGDSRSELSTLISEHRVGWTCNPAKPQKLAHQLDDITDSYLNNSSITIHPRVIMTKYFSESLALTKIKSVVNSTMII